MNVLKINLLDFLRNFLRIKTMIDFHIENNRQNSNHIRIWRTSPLTVSLVFCHTTEHTRGKKRAPCGDIFPTYSADAWYRLQRKQRRNLSFSTYKVSPGPLGNSGSVRHKYPGTRWHALFSCSARRKDFSNSMVKRHGWLFLRCTLMFF